MLLVLLCFERLAIDVDTAKKYRLLQDLLRSYGKVVIAYSGGVDSSLLSYVAHETLGDNAVSLTADAPVVPRSEFADSQAFCKRYSIRQVICHPNPIMMEEVRFNAPIRCYVCKKVIFGSLLEEAAKLGVETIADGSNLDDLGDYRPGLESAGGTAGEKPPARSGLHQGRYPCAFP